MQAAQVVGVQPNGGLDPWGFSAAFSARWLGALGFGFLDSKVRALVGKWGNPSLTSKPPFQATNCGEADYKWLMDANAPNLLSKGSPSKIHTWQYSLVRFGL